MRKPHKARPAEKARTPEQAVRAPSARAMHRAWTEKATRAYHEQIEKLPFDQQDHCRRLERRKDPDWPLAFVQNLVRDANDYRRIWAFAQMLYAREAPWDAGVQWFDNFFAPSFPAAHKENLIRLVLSICHDLDGRGRRKIQRTGRFRGGIRRMWEGSSHLPSNEGPGWGWIFCAHEPGSVIYLPAYKLAFQLQLGEALRFPRSAYPGISTVPEGLGARFTIESHPPPPEHQRTRLTWLPGAALHSPPARPSASVPLS